MEKDGHNQGLWWSLEVENNPLLNNQNENEDLVPTTKGTEF